jgi:hypothetical protein
VSLERLVAPDRAGARTLIPVELRETAAAGHSSPIQRTMIRT